jgi:hypothetical protein
MTVGRVGGVQPPTATVPPTLMPVRSVPVVTVSDVQAAHAGSVYGTGPHMPPAASVYTTGYMQSGASTGYLHTLPPQQFYPSKRLRYRY